MVLLLEDFKILLAIDIGLKRIGVAISHEGKIVFPQDAIIRKNRNQASNAVDELIRIHKADKLIVGLPKGGSSEDEMKRRIEHFISLLKSKIEIIYVDEYGSSNEAKELMTGVTKQKRDGKIDSIAAKIILERYIFTNL